MPYTKPFLKLKQAVKKQYLHKRVPKMYQKKYGKKYSLKETRGIAYAIAKKRRMRMH